MAKWKFRAFLLIMALTLISAGVPARGESEKRLNLSGTGAARPTATALTTVRIASGLSRPVFVCSPPGDNERLFILEQYTGLIKIWRNDSVLARPFMDIGDSLATNGNEQGLLGMAFHPAFETNRYFFINYTKVGGATVIKRYMVSANDPDSADFSSGVTIMTILQPYSNHNGGMIVFSPVDGYLYIGMGDGGSGGDPQNRAQDGSSLLGKMLRIDVDAGFPYGIPPDNPFVDSASTLDEIWAKGLRNPWRFSFDALTGEMYIGDVGQNAWEEISYQPAGSPGGENYGWRLKEGTHCHNPSTNCDPDGVLTGPIYEYSHASSRCSVTGGYVYRGCAIPDLQGTYFFADYCTSEIWTFRYDGTNITEFTDRTAELEPGGGITIDWISSFGVDNRGELYILDHLGGEIFKIVPEGVPSLCFFDCGDIDVNGRINILDITYLLNYLYKGGAAPVSLTAADVNGSGGINILDITSLIAHMYKGGPALSCPV